MEMKESFNVQAGDLCIYDPLAMTIYRKNNKLCLDEKDSIIVLVLNTDYDNHYHSCLTAEGHTIIIYSLYLVKIS